MKRFWEKVDKSADCWLWTGCLGAGYGQLWVGRKMVSAHRLSWEMERGAIPVGLSVLHRCDRKSCVRPDHLFLGTPADNTADMIAKGRGARGQTHGSRTHPERVARGGRNGARTQPDARPRGLRHGLAKLTDSQILVIRHLRTHTALRQREVARLFGIDKTTVSQIERNRTWTHVTGAAVHHGP